MSKPDCGLKRCFILGSACKDFQYIVYDVLCERGISLSADCALTILKYPQWKQLKKLDVHQRQHDFFKVPPIPSTLPALQQLYIHQMTPPYGSAEEYWRTLLGRTPSLQQLSVALDVYTCNYTNCLEHIASILQHAAPRLQHLSLISYGIVIHPDPLHADYLITQVIRHLQNLPPIVSLTLRTLRYMGGHAPFLAVDAPLTSLELEEDTMAPSDGLSRVGKLAEGTLTHLKWHVYRSHTIEHFMPLERFRCLRELEIHMDWLCGTTRLRESLESLTHALPPLVETVSLYFDGTTASDDEWPCTGEKLFGNPSIKTFKISSAEPAWWMRDLVRCLSLPNAQRLVVSSSTPACETEYVALDVSSLKQRMHVSLMNYTV